jgi:hypothetical protein
LVAEDRLDAVVAGEDAGQGRIAKKRRFIELGEMDILGPGGGAQEQEEYDDYSLLSHELVFIVRYRTSVTEPCIATT